MTTEEKNKWIEREKRFLEKQKEISGNKNASILSQITFCKDGVIIKKFMELNNEGGITVQNYSKTIAEVKLSGNNLEGEMNLLEETEFGKK